MGNGHINTGLIDLMNFVYVSCCRWLLNLTALASSKWMSFLLHYDPRSKCSLLHEKTSCLFKTMSDRWIYKYGLTLLASAINYCVVIQEPMLRCNDPETAVIAACFPGNSATPWEVSQPVSPKGNRSHPDVDLVNLQNGLWQHQPPHTVHPEVPQAREALPLPTCEVP